MKIGIVKPDYKIFGGFEVVVSKLVEELSMKGHEVEVVKVDATQYSVSNIPCRFEQTISNQNPEFFKYINDFWAYMKLDLSAFDAIISTQPPSFAVEHKNHFSLFYHHLKSYYDMSEVIVEAGLSRPIHKKSEEVIREIDTLQLKKVKKILAGSKKIKSRIKEFNGIENNVDVIYAGIDEEFYSYNGNIMYQKPIVVGRHEFPKRPELFVAAMKYLPNLEGRIIGEGGRTSDLKKIDKILTYAMSKDIKIDNDFLWKRMSNGDFTEEHEKMHYKNNKKSNINFLGKVNKVKLIEEYANALCVVCPAFEEDYGLTAIEAMCFKKPVIVCKDGGGYTELIENGYNGFVVEPTPKEIAKAIKYFSDNPERAIKMGENAYEFSRNFTWENTMNKLLKVLEESEIL